ncbi:MAG: ABC transporter permease [Deltaproteobacteria bacterium]|nr:ABC transporter permease [Deltaproteobacteria bacterium]
MNTERNAQWIVTSKSTGICNYMRELWSYRRLLGFLTNKILEKQYQRSTLGWLWLVIRPAMMVLMYTVLFGTVLGVDSGPLPFLMFIVLGLSVWTSFDRALTWSTRSMETVRGITKKVYFPKLMLPIAGQASGIIDLSVLLIYVAIVWIYYYFIKGQAVLSLGWELLAAPVGVILSFYMSLAMSLWTSVLDAISRDMRYSLRYFMQAWMFFTPVMYPVSRIPEKWRILIQLNPMTPVVENFRAAFVPHIQVEWFAFVYPFVFASIAFVSGLWFFMTFESETVDSL